MTTPVGMSILSFEDIVVVCCLDSHRFFSNTVYYKEHLNSTENPTSKKEDDTSGRLLRTADKSPSTPAYAAWLGGLPRYQHTAERRREAGRNIN